MSNNKMSNQKFCKVCQDAGKSEGEYRSHFIRETRDPNSKIICPTLLAIECRYCFKRGHTVKYCTTFKNKTAKNANNNNNNVKPKQNTNKTEKLINTFSCLYDSDDEQRFTPRTPSCSPPRKRGEYTPRTPSCSPPRKHDEFPELCTPKQFKHITSNYAIALSKNIETPVTQITTPVTQITTPVTPITTPVKVQLPNTFTINKYNPTNFKRPMKSWADDSSDEDEVVQIEW